MKLTFIEPPREKGRLPVERVFGCTYSLYAVPNIFNLYVAAVLKQNGIPVSYIDAAAENLSRKRFFGFISQDNSNIYYIHSVNLSLNSDIKLSRDILSLRKDCRIIFAGPGPTYFPEQYLYDKRLYVIRGEVELSALELVHKLKQGNEQPADISGISFSRNGSIVHNRPRPLLQDLDSLPPPAREILNRNLYHNPKLPGGFFTPLLTSRNCSYNCIFCVPNSQSFATELEYKKFRGGKPPVRLRSPENIIAEMDKIKQAGYKFVSIIDDQFLWEEERTLKICAGLKSLGVGWGCLARPDRIVEPVVRAMRQSGCSYVDLGVESFSQDVLDYVQKGLRVEAIAKSIELLKKYRIKVKINMLLGTNPFESEEDLWRNIKTSFQYQPEAVMFSIACPFPGTKFYDIARKNNWLRGGRYNPVSVQHDAILELPNLSARRLRRLIKKANLKFYLRPQFFRQNIFRVASPRNALFALRALYRKFAA